MTTIPGLWIFIVSGIILSMLVIHGIRNRKTAIGRAFLFLICCAWIWTIGFIFELTAETLESKLLFARIQYIGISIIPIAWLYLSSVHTGRVLHKALWFTGIGITTVSLIFIFLVPLPNLFWGSPSLVNVGSHHIAVDYDYGFWFYYILTPYITVSVLVSLGMLVHLFVQPHVLYRRQTFLIILGSIIPLVVNIFYVIEVTPVSHINYSSATLSITGLLFGYALFRYGYLDIYPLARDIIFENMHDAVIVLNNQRKIIDANLAMRNLIPLSVEIIGKDYHEVETKYIGKHLFDGLLNSDQEHAKEPLILDGRFYDVSYTHIVDRQGQGSCYFLVFHDVTEREKLHKKIEELGRRDPLTGVFNRRELFIRIEKVYTEMHRTWATCSLIMLDIDHFKDINDTYGHEVGDRVLETLAKVLFHNIKFSDSIGRYGGDEFIIVIPNSTEHDAVQLAERIRTDAGSQAIHASEEHTISIQLSLGVITFSCTDVPPSSDIASLLIAETDKALYEAKRLGRNQVYVGSNSLAGAGEAPPVTPL